MGKVVSMLFISWTFVFMFGCSSEDNKDELKSKGNINSSTNTTTESGLASVDYSGGSVQIQVRDFDSTTALGDIQVTSIELDGGLVIWADDLSNTYYPSSVYISFTDINPTTILLASVAVASDNGYRYAIKPTGFDAIFGAGLQETCVSGNILDIVNNQLSGNFESGSIIEISGAPANIVGQTSIYVGYTKTILALAAQSGNLNTIFNNTTGILSTDILNFCWLSDRAQVLPYIRVSVSRQSVGFNITNIDHLNFYPYFPTREDRTTKISYTWTGEPVLPITLSYTSVSCDPTINCITTSVTDLTANPIVDTFGCWGVGQVTSEFNVWQVTLTDSVGNTTAPATFSIRCGDDPNLVLQPEEIKVVSSQWGTKNWAPTNVFQTTDLPGWITYSFDSFPNAPTPNIEVLDFDIAVNNGVLAEIVFSYHNTGVDPGSLIAPPKYVYKLDCTTSVCVGAVFNPQSRRFILTNLTIPAVPGNPAVDNNFATGDVRVSGTLSW
ncbi:MAG: hypothetical protein ACC707_14390 [Thiohalomonadales bacterium]